MEINVIYLFIKHYVNTCYSKLIGYFELVALWNVFNFQDINLIEV